MSYSLAQDGFIRHYLYTGRKESEFSCDVREIDQLLSEKLMRAAAARHEPLTPPQAPCLGEPSPIGPVWKYYYSHDNIFVDDAAFYEELCRVELHAATGLVVHNPARVTLRLWSYAAVDVWVDGAPVCTLQNPVYKPIQYKDFTLDLSAGFHLLYLRLENLGVRDTRVSFAVQVIDGADAVEVELPDAGHCAPYAHAAALLDSARVHGGRLTLAEPLPAGSRLVFDKGISDFRRQDERYLILEAAGQQEIDLPEIPVFALEIPVEHTVLRRGMEQAELNRPVYLPEDTDHRRHMFERMAAVASEMRSATDGFALFPMLARKHLGMEPASDHEELKTTLEQINRRMDCADFMTTALIRLQREYGIPEDLQDQMKQVILNFRYWMDEPGQDGMCFWSENHTLMFFEAAYFFGGMYPDEVFVRSGRTGRELRDTARMRIREWLTDVCETGFDEFNSTVYTPLTLAALLNIVDYAEPDLAVMARRACDEMMRTLARHCFRGITVAPMGRVYRGVLAPWAESLQGLVHYLFPEAPFANSPALSFLATTGYTPPEGLRELMEETGFFTYTTSNARIDLYKTADYALTSVQSPRRDGVQRAWQRETREEMRGHFLHVKTMNERFHGTTQFQPGEFGYQQHMWSAALDSDLVVFANHPGHTCEDASEVRPGYWYGNGIMPALRQRDNVLGAVYVIPESHPIGFTHLFWEQDRFDETDARNGWIFGRKGDSYIGVWCSTPLEDHDETLFGCEKRAMSRRCAYLVVCGSRTENGSFADFCTGCTARLAAFDQASGTLHCAEFDLTFTPGTNGTQILE